MQSWGRDREVEKPKPFTETKKAVARDVLTRALVGLRALNHYSPCRQTGGHAAQFAWDASQPCCCWQAHAITFLERELAVYAPHE